MKIGNTTIEIKGLISKEDYQKNQSEIESSSKLRFYNNKDDFNLRLQNIKHDSLKAYINILIAIGVLILFSVYFKDKVLDDHMEKILQIVISLIIGVIVCFFFVLIRDKLISVCPKYSIFIFPIPILFFLYPIYKAIDPIYKAIDPSKLYSELYRIIVLFFMVGILLWLSYKFIKFLPSYMIDDYNNNITIFLTIVTLIFGHDLTSDWGMVFLAYLLNIVLIQIWLNLKLEKNRSEAEKIFEGILIGDEERTYTNLLLCYAKGGKKYKEIILSNKEFLEIVRREEL